MIGGLSNLPTNTFLRVWVSLLFQEACVIDREVGWEQATLNQRHWLSEDSIYWSGGLLKLES